MNPQRSTGCATLPGDEYYVGGAIEGMVEPHTLMRTAFSPSQRFVYEFQHTNQNTSLIEIHTPALTTCLSIHAGSPLANGQLTGFLALGLEEWRISEESVSWTQYLVFLRANDCRYQHRKQQSTHTIQASLLMEHVSHTTIPTYTCKTDKASLNRGLTGTGLLRLRRTFLFNVPTECRDVTLLGSSDW